MNPSNDGLSRRALLGVATKVAIGATIATAVTEIPGLAAAQERAAQGAGNGTADAAALNAALTLEFTAIKAYDAGIAILNNQHDAVAPVAKAVAQHFQSQHRGHADVLAAAVQSLGGTPVAGASVSFTPPTGFPAHPNTMHVLKLAANLEKQAALAYIAAVRQLSSGTLAQAAASLSATETQHWVVLYLLIKGEVAPTAHADPNDIAPKSFVTAIGDGNDALTNVPDFTYESAPSPAPAASAQPSAAPHSTTTSHPHAGGTHHGH